MTKIRMPDKFSHRTIQFESLRVFLEQRLQINGQGESFRFVVDRPVPLRDEHAMELFDA